MVRPGIRSFQTKKPNVVADRFDLEVPHHAGWL